MQAKLERRDSPRRKRPQDHKDEDEQTLLAIPRHHRFPNVLPIVRIRALASPRTKGR